MVSISAMFLTESLPLHLYLLSKESLIWTTNSLQFFEVDLVTPKIVLSLISRWKSVYLMLYSCLLVSKKVRCYQKLYALIFKILLEYSMDSLSRFLIILISCASFR